MGSSHAPIFIVHTLINKRQNIIKRDISILIRANQWRWVKHRGQPSHVLGSKRSSSSLPICFKARASTLFCSSLYLTRTRPGETNCKKTRTAEHTLRARRKRRHQLCARCVCGEKTSEESIAAPKAHPPHSLHSHPDRSLTKPRDSPPDLP